MAAVSRMWQVTVVNVDESGSKALFDPWGKATCKFTMTSMPDLTVEQFEEVMAREMVYAIREVKRLMIMKGLEP